MRARDSEPRYRGAIAHITGHIRIAAPIGQVSDMVAESRNEPSFNPAMTGVELLTPPPIGLGTRFRGPHGKGRHGDARRAHRVRPPVPARIADDKLDYGDFRGTDLRCGRRGTVMSWDWQVARRAGCGCSAGCPGRSAAAWSARSGAA